MQTQGLTPRSAPEIAALVRRAEAECARQGLRLTPLRRRVLELLLAEAGPSKAYDLLSKIGDDAPAKPPTVYRALDFLIETGLAHRIESLNAYVACSHHDHGGGSVFLLCRNCGRTEEQHAGALEAVLNETAESRRFTVEHAVIEVRGLCPDCRG